MDMSMAMGYTLEAKVGVHKQEDMIRYGTI